MSATPNERLEEVRAELRAVAERLGDLAYEELRRAVEAGEARRPDLERQLTRARHAVERALAVLGDADGGDMPTP